jgi:hypothetical protein
MLPSRLDSLVMAFVILGAVLTGMHVKRANRNNVAEQCVCYGAAGLTLSGATVIQRSAALTGVS